LRPATGGRLAYQQILNQLSAPNRECSTDARTFFRRNLDHPDANGAFRYLKRSQTHILSKDDDIAKKWTELIENDPVIALRFAQMRLSL